MIAKISTGSIVKGMVLYNHNKTETKENGFKEADLLGVENIPSNDVNSIINKIQSRNNLNKNVSKPNIHISLNFHKDDVLDNNQIYEIGLDYMEKLGYKEQPFAVYRHFDKEHPHIHIVSSSIDSNGKKINDSHLHRRSQKITRELELKYNITIATKQIGNKVENKPLDTLINEHLEHNKHSLTGILAKILDEVMGEKPTSEKQFEHLLSTFQTSRTISEKDGEKKGHYFHLLTYEQIGDENFKKKDKGINGSDLDINFSYESIKNQIELNDQVKMTNLKSMMGRVYSIKSTDDKPLKLTELALELRKKGIILHAKRKQTGNDINSIYALNFKNIKTGITYSASDLKIKTNDFLKRIIDDEKFNKRKEKSTEVYLDKKNPPEDKVLKNEEQTEKDISSISSILQDFLETKQVADNEENLNSKRKRKRRRN